MKSFAVIALLACFLGVLMTTVASDGPFETPENQEDKSKLRASDETVENDGVDQEDEEEESEDVDDKVDDPESVNSMPEDPAADPKAFWGRRSYGSRRYTNYKPRRRSYETRRRYWYPRYRPYSYRRSFGKK